MKPSKRATKKVEELLQKIDWRTYGNAVIGVDEVGRGCLAGPVGAAACLFVKSELEDILTDSKKLSEAKREEYYRRILETHPVAYATASPEEIDELNILQASLLAMKRSVQALEASLVGGPLEAEVRKAMIVVDGTFRIPDLPVSRQKTLIKGDLRCAPISAASIFAKVSRDRWMKEQAVNYPGYHFEIHKGYGTVLHREAIDRQGPCALHRRSFAGLGARISAGLGQEVELGQV